MKAPKPPDDCLEDIASDVVKEGKLSNLQLEAVAYANMCFGKNLEDGSRRGFFIGDGAGIGKGRELAGIVAQQWARGVRKHLWISVSNDLKFDAERDLRDLGSGNIPVQLLGKASYSVACGVLFFGPWGRRDGGRATPSTRHTHAPTRRPATSRSRASSSPLTLHCWARRAARPRSPRRA